MVPITPLRLVPIQRYRQLTGRHNFTTQTIARIETTLGSKPVSYTHLLADAIMDRLVANASKIELKGDSMRQKLKK